MSDADKIAKINEQNRKRQERYLQNEANAIKHKEANRASYLKRKEAKKAEALAKAKEEPKTTEKAKPKKKLIIRKKKEEEPSGMTAAEIKELEIFTKNAVAIQNAKGKKFKLILTEKNKSKPKPAAASKAQVKNVVRLEDIKTKLGEAVENVKSRDMYLSSVKRIMKLFEEDDLYRIIRRKDFIEKITKDRPINTAKADLQAVLKLIDTIPIDVPVKLKSQIKLAFDAAKIRSSDKAAETKEDVITFSDYRKKVEDMFGKDSKEFAVTELYHELPLRDDMILKVVDSIKDTIDKKTNYLVLTKSPKARVIMNHFKTEKGFDKLDEVLSTRLTNILKKYMNSKTDKEYLFTASKLTQFISNMNKKLGLKGGASLFRHMAVEQFLSTAKTPEERAKFAELMKHSVNTQLKYLRNK